MLRLLGALLAGIAIVNGQGCTILTVEEGKSVTIQSANYPNNYPANHRACWTISGPAQKGLVFTVNAFVLESSCSYDYLEIEGNKHCGTAGPNGYVARSPVTVNFATDSSVHYSGFHISISSGALPSNECGGDVTVEEGKTAWFVSPRYPANYNDGASCSWTISGPAGKGLEFNSAAFSLEGGSCGYDYLELSEVVNGATVSRGKFCDVNGPRKLRSTTNVVTATFKSDSSINRPGFNVTVKPANCPGQGTCPNDPNICISHTQYCNNVTDCPDGVDEQNCNGECGHTPVKPDLDLTKTGRIVGGQEAIPHSWPWQVAFLTSSGSQICGGSLIHSKWVMTAAHCCVARAAVPASYKVLIGAHTLSRPEATSKVHTLSQVVVHKNYKSSPATTFDFCLLELEEPADVGHTIVPVCLGEDHHAPAGKKCFVTGWGNSGPRSALGFGELLRLVDEAEAGKLPKEFVPMLRGTNVIHQVDVNIAEQSVCNTAYNGVISSDMICASAPGKDTCQGDSGGPLVCQAEDGNMHLVGVTSWGRGCASPGYPGVYGRISHVQDWITQTMFGGSK